MQHACRKHKTNIQFWQRKPYIKGHVKDKGIGIRIALKLILRETASYSDSK
jgi:hypothetical protein